MKNNQYLKIVIPVIAILVIAESVVLVSGLRKEEGNKVKVEEEKVKVVTPSSSMTEGKTVVFDVAIESESKAWKLGSPQKVTVKMTSRERRALDAVNLYVKYNPSVFEIRNMIFGDKLPKPVFSKPSIQKSVIVTNYLISDPKGLQVNGGEVVSLLEFEAVPKGTGVFDFEISTGSANKESVTMFVENATSKALTYSSNKLTVNVLK